MSIQLIPYKPAGTIGSGPYVLREYKPDTGIDISALSITYTGAHTDYGMVTMSDGARYRLLAFTSSGTLSIEQPVNCEVCVVGGGANGTAGDKGYTYTGGGAGAYMKNQVIEAFEGGAVVVGAAQGASSIGDVSVSAVSGKNGGTGGGNKGTGDGLSKYPFGDTTYSLWADKPHCGGGGAGGASYRSGPDSWDSYSYGNGGSNGSNGAAQTVRERYGIEHAPGGSGGLYGGGNGGNATYGQYNGANATYYGSGGGKGAYYYYYDADIGNGGSGYQGIVYLRIPVEQ